MEILVTGCAGFIGFHLCQKLISSGFSIVGVDNLSEYYNVELKQNRLKILKTQKNFVNYQLDIQDFHRLKSVINSHNISKIVNLAAQAGVRYSIKNPKSPASPMALYKVCSKPNTVEKYPPLLKFDHQAYRNFGQIPLPTQRNPDDQGLIDNNLVD